MMDSKTSVKDFIDLHFIRYDELAGVLEYEVAGNSIKSWLIGRFRPPSDFEKKCQNNKGKLLNYSEKKLRNDVFENYPKRKPPGFWKRNKTHRYALEWLCKKKKWDFPFGLYNLKKDDLMHYNLDGLSNYYKLSPVRIVTSILPEFDWKIWKFQMAPMGFWNEDKNKNDYLKWFEKKLNIKSIDDWYNISVKDFKNNYGSTLISAYFDGSIASIVKYKFPRLNIDYTKFNRTSPKHLNLKSLTSVKKLIDDRAKDLGFKFPDDYYKFSLRKHLKEIRLSYFNVNSLSELLNKLYPEYQFYPWIFGKVPNSFWLKNKNIIEYTKWLARELNIMKLDEWYDINGIIVDELYGSGIKKTVYEMVSLTYTEYNWDPTLFDKKRFTSQKRLFSTLNKIYNEEIFYNYRHPNIINPKTNYPLELDCYIESLKIAFEFQGIQHNEKIERFFHKKDKGNRSFKASIFRDKFKKQKCKELGIKLIEVDQNTWDFTVSGLKKIISNHE